MNTLVSPDWLLLVVSLPTASATARMRIWRTLKGLGCMALRDGAYLLPGGAAGEEALQDLAKQCVDEGGNAWLMTVQPRADDEATAYRMLFDRTRDYAELRKNWKSANRTLPSLDAAELARLKRKLQREYDTLRSIDFFPSEVGAEAEDAWIKFSTRIDRLVSPDEPHQTAGRITRLDVGQYQGRVWATRRRLWVDRVTSAWLIRRFIDRQARFRWLADPADCPKRALGFDFDGAAFTHIGERITFEVLMASFGLEADAALTRLAAMVRALDVGGEAVPEARGFEAVLAGARERCPNDDALLDAMSMVLDSLYAHFESEAARDP